MEVRTRCLPGLVGTVSSPLGSDTRVAAHLLVALFLEAWRLSSGRRLVWSSKGLSPCRGFSKAPKALPWLFRVCWYWGRACSGAGLFEQDQFVGSKDGCRRRAYLIHSSRAGRLSGLVHKGESLRKSRKSESYFRAIVGLQSAWRIYCVRSPVTGRRERKGSLIRSCGSQSDSIERAIGSDNVAEGRCERGM